MTLSDVKAIVGDTPNMSIDQAQKMQSLIVDHGLRDVLELGFQHGVSTSYIASTLAGNGGGHVTSIDRLKPDRAGKEKIEVFLDELGLRNSVTIHYEPAGYLWRLMHMLDDDPTPRFDLCYIDGGHSWAVDGFAFLLVDLLMKPGGWIVFDDLDWTFGGSASAMQSPMVQQMTDEERACPQVRKVYELLVKPSGRYGDFKVEDGWAYARKLDTVSSEGVRVITEKVLVREQHGLGEVARGAYGKLRKRMA